MPTKIVQRRTYPAQRAKKTPPHVTLAGLREAAGLTQDELCDRVREAIPEARINRGTISARPKFESLPGRSASPLST